MTVYQDELSTMVRMEEEDNGATREDWMRAIDMVYTAPPSDLILVKAALALYGIDIGLGESQRSLEPAEMKQLHDRLVELGQIDVEPEFEVTS